MELLKIKEFMSMAINGNKAIWMDSLGSYTIEFIDSLYNKICDLISCGHILFDTELSKVVLCEETKSIISIGGFIAHNEGKKESNRRGIPLITIPTQLSNDSFGTNRYSIENNEEVSSLGGNFPAKTLFDLSMIKDNDIDKSLWGIGEYVGLYFSVIDYSLKKRLNFDSLMFLIVKNIYRLTHIKDTYLKLKMIASLLTMKCLVMRNNGDHEIGCGIDHSFARYIEKEYKMSHGKSVYLGSILSLLLFPEWEKWGLSMDNLLKIGTDIGVSKKDIIKIKYLNLEEVIAGAIKMRPRRSLSLESLYISGNKKRIINTNNKIQDIWEKLS